MKTTNTKSCFVELWLRLGRLEEAFAGEHHLYCMNNIVKQWLKEGVITLSQGMTKEDFLYMIYLKTTIEGFEQLPTPSLYPLKHRELIRAIVALDTGIGMNGVKLKDLDSAYSVAYPQSTPINKSKKKYNQ